MLALLLISVVTSLPRQPSPSSNPRAATLLLHRYLRRPPTSPSTSSPPASAPPCLLFCHFSARRPPTPRTTGKEHPDYLREIDLSARYPIYRPRHKHIALDDISPSFSSSGLDVTVRRRPALSKKDGQLCHDKYILFFFHGGIIPITLRKQ